MEGKQKQSAWAMMLDWLWVGIPLAWGVLETVQKTKVLFH